MKITTMLLSAALVAAACSDNGPTGPSPLPGPNPGTPPTTTPPTTTPPGGNNGVPQVAGTYRGSGTAEFKPSSTSGLGPRTLPDACTEVEQDGTIVTIEVPINPWEIRGTITRSGHVEDITVLEKDKTALHMESVLFDGESLRVELSTAGIGSPYRDLLNLEVKRQPAPAEKCDRTGQTARPGNRD